MFDGGNQTENGNEEEENSTCYIPPTMGKVTTMLDVLAYVATPMSKKATICSLEVRK